MLLAEPMPFQDGRPSLQGLELAVVTDRLCTRATRMRGRAADEERRQGLVDVGGRDHRCVWTWGYRPLDTRPLDPPPTHAAPGFLRCRFARSN
jgi:hypothetical protein